ncbi:MAG: 50S ribosome-binding GTPase [Firmicutes bacterium]|nr:50S ribosome-binding GTPase [Bacillota bacterium]
MSGASFSLTVALAGNPNCGKTTLFNVLTGGHRHVGNWPGVTVEKWEGRATLDGTHIRVVDLPGVYCLSGASEDQRVARDYLLGGEADIVVSVVDATDLARHLGLTLELLEVGLPVVVALNMTDLASRRGLVIDRSALAARLGVPVVATVATTGDGVEELLRRVVAAARERPARMRPRAMGEASGTGRAAGEDLVAYLAQRHALAEEIAGEVTSSSAETEAPSPSDRIDRFLTHRYWGVLVLLVTLGVALSVTFAVGIPLSDALTSLIHRGGRAGAGRAGQDHQAVDSPGRQQVR